MYVKLEGVIRSRKSKEGRKYNGQKKKGQNLTHKANDWETRTPQKNRGLTQVLRKFKL